jgi:DNA-binding NarL/FixJ family response regulator
VTARMWSGADRPFSWGRSAAQRGQRVADDSVLVNIAVITAFDELRSSLEAWAARRPDTRLVPLDEAGPGDVVFTTMTDCSPQECQWFAAKGRKLVVLAALPSDHARDVYLAAGAAAYVPMNGGTEQLEAALQSALEHRGDREQSVAG